MFQYPRPRLCSLIIVLLGFSILVPGLAAAADSLVLSPKPGSFVVPIPVLIAPVRPLPRGSVIVYTVDGSVPTAASWRIDGPILVTDPTTIRAAVLAPTGALSQGVSGSYVVDCPFTTERPQFTPAPGISVGPFAVTVTSPTLGAEILYTLIGNEPTCTATRYQTPLPVDRAMIVATRAFGGYFEVALGSYRVRLPKLFPSGVAIGSFSPQVSPPVLTPQRSFQSIRGARRRR